MSVKVDICKNIESFHENIIAGFNLKQTLVVGSALIIGAATAGVCIMVLHIPTMVSCYLIIPVCAPIILIGFSNRDGMGFIERYKRQHNLKNMHLSNFSTENPQTFNMLMEESRKEQQKENPVQLNELTEEQIRKRKNIFNAIVAASVILFAAIMAAMIIIIRK